MKKNKPSFSNRLAFVSFSTVFSSNLFFSFTSKTVRFLCYFQMAKIPLLSFPFVLFLPQFIFNKNLHSFSLIFCQFFFFSNLLFSSKFFYTLLFSSMFRQISFENLLIHRQNQILFFVIFQ